MLLSLASAKSAICSRLCLPSLISKNLKYAPLPSFLYSNSLKTYRASPDVTLDIQIEYTNLFFSLKMLHANCVTSGTTYLGSKTSSRPCVAASASTPLLNLAHRVFSPLNKGYCFTSSLTLVTNGDIMVDMLGVTVVCDVTVVGYGVALGVNLEVR